MENKKNSLAKKTATMTETLLSATKQEIHKRRKSPEIIMDGVVVRMPLEIILSRANFTGMQLKIITSVMKTIGEKVLDELTKKKNLTSLFAAEEFGEDPMKIQFVVYEKEFKFGLAHKKDLEEALLMMHVVPIEIPIIGNVTGKKYRTYTNLCSITIPEGQEESNKYCIVKMGRDVANHIVNENSVYANILTAAQKNLKKYSIRMYWFTRAYCYSDERTFTFEYMYDLLCKDVENFDKYSVFEKHILSNPKKDLDELFEKGIIDYRFEYHPTNEERKRMKQRKNPKEIKFVFFRKKELPSSKKMPLSPVTSNNLEKKLMSEFGLFSTSAKEIVSKLTMANIEAFDQRVSKVRDEILADRQRKPRKIKREDFYAFGSFNRFFIEFDGGFTDFKDVTDEKPAEKPETHEETVLTSEELESVSPEVTTEIQNISPDTIDYHALLKNCDALNCDLGFIKRPETNVVASRSFGKGQEYWRGQWCKCRKFMERFGYDIAYYLSKMMSMDSYDEQKHILRLTIPGPTRDVEEFIEQNFKETFRAHIIQFFPSDVQIEYIVVKFVTKEETEWKEQLHGTEDYKKANNSLFHPRDEKGNHIAEEIWKWNLCRYIIAQYMNEQEFSETFAKMELFTWEKNIGSEFEPFGLRLIFSIPDNETVEKIENKHVNLLAGVLQRIYSKNVKIGYKIKEN